MTDTNPCADLQKVIDMLYYYYFDKSKLELITPEMLEEALELLRARRNPFLDEKFFQKLDANASKYNYLLSHHVFNIELIGDRRNKL